MKTASIYLSVILCLQLSSNQLASAQASFTGAPVKVAPVTPRMPVINSAAAAPRTNTPTVTNIPVGALTPTLPSLSPTMSGVILPTDTLMRTIHTAAPQNGGTANSGDGKGQHAPERIVEISDLKSFLEGNDWHYGMAEDWLTDFDQDHAIIEEAGDPQTESEFLPIAYVSESSPKSGLTSTRTAEQTKSVEAPHVMLRLTAQYRELHVFDGPHQALVDGESVMTAIPGTVVSSHKDYFTLHMGALSVDTGNAAAKIATSFGGIKIAPQSTCEIDYQPGKRLIVRSIQGPGTVAKVKLISMRNRIVDVVAGEQVSIDFSANGSLGAEQIVHEKCQLTPLEQNLEHKFSGEGAKLMHRMSEHLVHANQIPPESATAHEPKVRECAPLHLIASENSYLTTTDKGQIGLILGRFLVATESPQIVQCRTADLYMQPHAVAAIEVADGLMRAECCTTPRSVIVVSKKAGIPMHWGMESVVVDHAATWEEAIPQDGIGRRAFEIHRRDGREFVISDFHMGSMLAKSPHLHVLRVPAHHRHVALREKLLRIAASLEVVTAEHGGYQVNQPANTNNSASSGTSPGTSATAGTSTSTSTSATPSTGTSTSAAAGTSTSATSSQSAATAKSNL